MISTVIFRKSITLSKYLLISALLTSCGGGGGGGGGSSSDDSSEDLSASFTVSNSSGTIPLTTSFDASQSQGDIISYEWEFRTWDSNNQLIATDTGINPSYTFTEVNDYQIILTVTDSEQETATSSSIVNALGYSLSGTITAPNSSVADSDTADPNVNISNNSFASAQLLPTTAVVGGYLSNQVDDDDYFSVSLQQNQEITVNISNYQIGISPDIDLYLYDSDQNLVNSAVGIGANRSLTVTQDGDYFIRLDSVRGQSNYTLRLNSSLATSNRFTTASTQEINGYQQQFMQWRLSDDFVVGEAIFKKKDSTNANALSSRATANKESKYGRLRMSEMTQANALSNNLQQAINNDVTLANLDASQTEKLKTLQWIKQLHASGEYEYAEPNFYRHATLTPNDQYYPLQWHYPQIQLEEALDIQQGDSNVIVAVIDSGVLLNHPDFQGQLVSGYDFISDPSLALDGDGIDSDPDDPGDGSLGGSSSFHGSHVAGVVAAATNNNTGVAGVAGGTRIMPLRVLGRNGSGTTADIIEAVEYAAGYANDSGTTPSQTVDIINLSLGSNSFSQTEQDLMTDVYNDGIIIIAAAGNSNTSTPFYPAAYNNVISVSATTIENEKAGYSNFGSTIDIAAPGGDLSTDLNGDGNSDGILSAIGDDSSGSTLFTYGFYEGTSMAAPHVAGVAALMKSQNTNLTAAQFDALLTSDQLTDDLGTAGKDTSFGYGLINARKAVLAAGGASNAPATILTSPSAVNFATLLEDADINISDSSDGDLTISSVTDDASWLTVTASNTDASGFGSYTLAVDRSGLSDAIYSATITFNANVNPSGTTSSTIDVTMQVSSTPVSGDAGYLYILAVDPDSFDTITFTEASANNGTYEYEIENTPPGDYEIIAGTDMNDDNFICDTGESCGGYPTLDQNSIVTITDEDIDNLNFTVSFDSQLTGSSASNEEVIPSIGISRLIKDSNSGKQIQSQ
jgi:serine protease